MNSEGRTKCKRRHNGKRNLGLECSMQIIDQLFLCSPCIIFFYNKNQSRIHGTSILWSSLSLITFFKSSNSQKMLLFFFFFKHFHKIYFSQLVQLFCKMDSRLFTRLKINLKCDCRCRCTDFYRNELSCERLQDVRYVVDSFALLWICDTLMRRE